jgi:hypothetical protein
METIRDQPDIEVGKERLSAAWKEREDRRWIVL